MSRRITPEAILDEYEALGFPSADKLHKSLKNKGYQVTYKDILSFTKAQPVRQVFAPSPWNKRNFGQVAALDLNDRWFGDLIDYSANPATYNGQRYTQILVVQDVFSRKLYARALKSKSPGEVAEALKSIIAEAGDKPSSFETDQGREFEGAVEQLLDRESIIHRTKLPIQKHALATLDRAIATLRGTLSRLNVERGQNWVEGLTRALSAYNRSPHAALGPAAPEDVQDSDVLQHLMRKENAQKAMANHSKAQDLVKKFEGGQFRMPIVGAKVGGGNAFRRGFKPKWGPAKRVAEARPGILVDEEGKEHPMREALPVEVAGPDVEVSEGLLRGKKIPERAVGGIKTWVKANQPATREQIQTQLRSLNVRMKITTPMLRAIGLTLVGGKGWYVEGDQPAPVRVRRPRAKAAPAR
jgi:hypothetical protein